MRIHRQNHPLRRCNTGAFVVERPLTRSHNVQTRLHVLQHKVPIRMLIEPLRVIPVLIRVEVPVPIRIQTSQVHQVRSISKDDVPLLPSTTRQRERSAMSLRKLAETAGISNPYLSQIERGLRKPSAEILKSLARALSISAETLYERAGLLDEVGVRRDVPEAIAADETLTKAQKTALLEIYGSFVGDEEQ